VPHSPKRERSETNGHAADDEDDADGEIEVSVTQQPAKKKQKRVAEDDDARLAAALQAQENQMARRRTTRGGETKPPKKKTKVAKKKSAAKIRGDDDSDVDSSEANGTKRKASGGFQKPFNLSFPLAEVTGAQQVGCLDSSKSTEDWN
jgi:hypothetical protein